MSDSYMAMDLEEPSDKVPSSVSRRIFALHLLALMLITLAAYANSFHVPFTFDDFRSISDSNFVKDLGNFTEFWKSDSHEVKVRTVAYLSLAINYAVHSNEVFGYHVVNFCIHSLSALLVYLLVLTCFRTPLLRASPLLQVSGWIALFSALLFACHPVQTEAVTYIVQRITSLATLLYLFALVAYGQFRLKLEDGGSLWTTLFWFGFSLFSTVLAMKTKEIAITLPIALLLFEFIFFRTSIYRRLFWLAPFILTLLIIPLSMFEMKGDTPLGALISDLDEVSRETPLLSRWVYLFTQFRVLVTYLRLYLLPVNQNLSYDFPVSNSFFDVGVIIAFLFLLALLSVGFYLWFLSRRSTPIAGLIAFGIFWFFLANAVESSVIPITDVINEHRPYLPSIGVFVASVTAVFWLAQRWREDFPAAVKVLVTGLSVIVLIFAGATYARNEVWRDGITLWSDVVAKSPENAKAYNNLGIVYEQKGQLDEAIEQYMRAVALDQGYAMANFNLGIAYAAQNKIDLAISYYRKTLSLQPGWAKAHFNLGVSFMSKGLMEQAGGEFQRALELDPGLTAAKRFLNYTQRQTGQ
jgi:hypothetical protein